jgi:hypothetical protein
MSRIRKFTKLIEILSTMPNSENPEILKILIQIVIDMTSQQKTMENHYAHPA